MTKNENAVIKLNKLSKKEKENDWKIEAIKNLIFGDNIQAFNSEFESLKSDIQKKKRILEEMVDEVREGLQKSIDDVAIDTNIRITELEQNLGDKIDALEDDIVTRKVLSKLLIDLGKKVGK